MREHLRREGWITQLFGVTRPSVLLLYVTGLVSFPERSVWLLRDALGLLALLTITQLLLRRQPQPVWTQKALAVTATAFLLTVALLAWVARVHLFTLPFVVLLQPAMLAASWLLWKPTDLLLKRRTQERALRLRAQHQDLLCVGITGSVGKTTTKELLAHLLQSRGAVATPAYVNSEMGVANWLCQKLQAPSTKSQTSAQSSKLKAHILIVEMGAYRAGEIKRLCDIVQPQIGVMTHVGLQHLGLFGSAAAIRDAKAELFEALPPSGTAFLNAESEGVRSLASRARCPVVTVGLTAAATLYAHEVREEGGTIRFRIAEEPFEVPLPGTHNITNILLALAVARHVGMRDDEIRERLLTVRPLQHTFTVKRLRTITLLDDTHNASPESFRAALEWARVQKERPRVLLTGGLLELGREEEHIMQELGACASGAFERVIFTGKRGKSSFQAGYKDNVEVLSRSTTPVPQGALLLCLGRMPLSVLHRLLPAKS